MPILAFMGDIQVGKNSSGKPGEDADSTGSVTEQCFVNDKITASCQANMSPKHYFKRYTRKDII